MRISGEFKLVICTLPQKGLAILDQTQPGLVRSDRQHGEDAKNANRRDANRDQGFQDRNASSRTAAES